MSNNSGHPLTSPRRKRSHGTVLRKFTSCFCVQPDLSPPESGRHDFIFIHKDRNDLSGNTSRMTMAKGDSALCLQNRSEPEHPPNPRIHQSSERPCPPFKNTDSNKFGRVTNNVQGIQIIHPVGESRHCNFRFSRDPSSSKGDEQISSCTGIPVNSASTVSCPEKLNNDVFLFGDRLDPIFIAANEIVSASKSLTNAIESLKKQVCFNVSKNDVTRKQMLERMIMAPGEKSELSTDYNVKSLDIADTLSDLPPLSESEKCNLINADNVYHFARHNPLILIEDLDAVEPIHQEFGPNINSDTLLNKDNYLVPPEEDKAAKSYYPGLSSTVPTCLDRTTYSSVLKRGDSVFTHESHSNCQTLITSTFQLFSNEETQVTEFDEALTTDEGENSYEFKTDQTAQDQLSAGDQSPAGNKLELEGLQSAPSLTNAIPGLPKVIPRNRHRTIQLHSDKLKNIDLRSPKPPSEEKAQTTEFTCLTWDTSPTNSIGDGRLLPACASNASEVIQPKEETCDRPNNASVVPNTRTLPVILDADDLLFEVQCQRNNHNNRPPASIATSEDNIRNPNESNPLENLTFCHAVEQSPHKWNITNSECSAPSIATKTQTSSSDCGSPSVQTTAPAVSSQHPESSRVQRTYTGLARVNTLPIVGAAPDVDPFTTGNTRSDGRGDLSEFERRRLLWTRRSARNSGFMRNTTTLESNSSLPVNDLRLVDDEVYDEILEEIQFLFANESDMREQRRRMLGEDEGDVVVSASENYVPPGTGLSSLNSDPCIISMLAASPHR
ncbi:hypothetical protein T265_07864 [Opisthorchis viverrini]|uniref:Uncharacterized protein n=1 Tax=Opisthorchis viverrini TaxID=6198 RepID=A0A074ZBI9_OPIVI|nr:hypothetical protein T265_07864 [Opisthorchis viverrini]KER24503.1 hypothetical protein T265_07864 [Opisthorchis viverrini]